MHVFMYVCMYGCMYVSTPASNAVNQQLVFNLELQRNIQSLVFTQHQFIELNMQGNIITKDVKGNIKMGSNSCHE